MAMVDLCDRCLDDRARTSGWLVRINSPDEAKSHVANQPSGNFVCFEKPVMQMGQRRELFICYRLVYLVLTMDNIFI